MAGTITSKNMKKSTKKNLQSRKRNNKTRKNIGNIKGGGKLKTFFSSLLTKKKPKSVMQHKKEKEEESKEAQKKANNILRAFGNYPNSKHEVVHKIDENYSDFLYGQEPKHGKNVKSKVSGVNNKVVVGKFKKPYTPLVYSVNPELKRRQQVSLLLGAERELDVTA